MDIKIHWFPVLRYERNGKSYILLALPKLNALIFVKSTVIKTFDEFYLHLFYTGQCGDE